MTAITVTDAGGATMKLADVKGRLLVPDMTVDIWESFYNMKTRSDDVIICSYPKTGCNWTWDIVTMLTRGDSSPVMDQMNSRIMDFAFNSIPKLESYPPPRVYSTHRYYNELPIMARGDRCKLIYLLRDPRDVSVSYYNHVTCSKPLDYKGKIENFLQLYMDGKVLFNSYWEHILQWGAVQKQHPHQPLLVLHYEDTKKDPETSVRRLAEFLEVKADDSLIRDIVHNTSFEVMKKHKESLNFNLAGRFNSGGKSMMYRKGVVGDWRNWLTEEQGQRLLDFFKSKLEHAELGALRSVRQYFR